MLKLFEEELKMPKPQLIIITGMAASGKSTLSKLLAEKICFPRLSRDELKEGLVNTFDLSDQPLEKNANEKVFETFFQTIELFLSRNISMIAEAAFQDKLWKPELLPLINKAEIKLIICQTDLTTIKARFAARFSNDPGRQKFHGDQTLSKQELDSLTKEYQPLTMELPTLFVDTTNDYKPLAILLRL